MNTNSNQASSTLQSPVVVQQATPAPITVGETMIDEDNSHSCNTSTPANAHSARGVHSSSSSNSSISSRDDEEDDSRSSISSHLFEHREVAEAEDVCNRQDGRATSASVPPADFCDNSSHTSSTSGSGSKSSNNLPAGSTEIPRNNASNGNGNNNNNSASRRPRTSCSGKKKTSDVKRTKSNASSCSSSSSLSANLPPSSVARSSSRTNKLSCQHQMQQQHHHHSRFTTDVTRPSSTATSDIVRTDEIALFMRNKKRYSQSDLKPIPPAPGGWDEPDRIVPWDKTADHDFSSSLPVKSNAWKNVSWIHEVDASQPSTPSYDKPTRPLKQRPISEPNIRAQHLRPPSSNTKTTSSSSSSSLPSAASSNTPASAHRKERPCSLELSDCSAFRPLLYAQQKQHTAPQPPSSQLPPFRMRSSSHHELQLKPVKDMHPAANDAAVGRLPSKISTDTSKYHPLVPPPESPRSFLDTPSLWSDGFLGRKRAPHSATAAVDMARSAFEDSFANDTIHPPWKLASQDWQRTPKGASPAHNCWGPISPLSPPWHHPLDESRTATPEVRRWDAPTDHGWEDRFASILRVVDDECNTPATTATSATTVSSASSLSRPFHPPPPPSTTTSNSSSGNHNNNSHNEAAAASAMAAAAATWPSAPGTTHSKNRLHHHQDGFLVANAQLLQNIVQTGSMGCRHCGSGTHTAARDCPYIPLLNPSDAWLALRESGQRGDTRAFLRALDIYSKSRPTETLPTVAQQLHQAGSLLHLIAVRQQQQQLPTTTLLIDLQGITRKHYRVIVASLADKQRVPGFPTSLEQNLARLAEAGFPRDLTDMATCLLCDQTGHWAKDCVYNTSHAAMASIRRASDPVGGSKRHHPLHQLHPNFQQSHQQQQQQLQQQQQQQQQQQSYPMLNMDESRHLYLSGAVPL